MDITYKALFAAFGDMPYQTAFVLVILILVLCASALQGRRRRSRRSRTKVAGKPFAAPEAFDATEHAAHQLAAIAGVEFERLPILNRAEAKLLPLLENIAEQMGENYRVFAQCSLGELIRPSRGANLSKSENKRAYLAINSKRLDFAIVDGAGLLRVAIEYQGAGHHQGTAFLRDAVKREAVRKSGATFLEIEHDLSAPQVKERVIHALNAGQSGLKTSTFRRSHAALHP